MFKDTFKQIVKDTLLFLRSSDAELDDCQSLASAWRALYGSHRFLAEILINQNIKGLDEKSIHIIRAVSLSYFFAKQYKYNSNAIEHIISVNLLFLKINHNAITQLRPNFNVLAKQTLLKVRTSSLHGNIIKTLAILGKSTKFPALNIEISTLFNGMFFVLNSKSPNAIVASKNWLLYENVHSKTDLNLAELLNGGLYKSDNKVNWTFIYNDELVLSPIASAQNTVDDIKANIDVHLNHILYRKPVPLTWLDTLFEQQQIQVKTKPNQLQFHPLVPANELLSVLQGNDLKAMHVKLSKHEYVKSALLNTATTRSRSNITCESTEHAVAMLGQQTSYYVCVLALISVQFRSEKPLFFGMLTSRYDNFINLAQNITRSVYPSEIDKTAIICCTIFLSIIQIPKALSYITLPIVNDSGTSLSLHEALKIQNTAVIKKVAIRFIHEWQFNKELKQLSVNYYQTTTTPPSENKLIQLIRLIEAIYVQLVIAGCLPWQNKNLLQLAKSLGLSSSRIEQLCLDSQLYTSIE